MKFHTVDVSTKSDISKEHKIVIELNLVSYNDGVYTSRPPQATTKSRSSPAKLVHSLFERTAESTPNAIAVQFEHGPRMTYQELNETANRVARQLVCGRGIFVPIVVQRSVNLVISLLAVMKAGAAYILLSPDAPNDRNKFIIEDARAPFVITDETTTGRFSKLNEISIEDLLAQSEQNNTSNLNIHQASNDHAYVIYTSGTTGRPKGVLLSHRAACCGLSALPAPEPSQPLRQLLCHSPNFSAAQRTILGTLTRGGTLCLASKESLTLHLHDTITDMAITTLEITPSMLKLIDPNTVPDTVKRISLGGEIVNPSLVDLWAGRVELVSAYGLSECTQLNMRQKLSPGENTRVIGKPSDTTTAYVLAPDSTAALPPRIAGELCLAGPQLADGYLNLHEKTQEVFIPNPFGAGKLYRTGDMVIADENGTIEIIGRIDQQTKIDGQRVEPNESNSILQVCHGVITSSVVSATVLNRRALVAVIVPERDRKWKPLVRELRSRLRESLPSYAVPTYWVQRDELPLNVSGKVDIAALVKEVEGLGEDGLMSGFITPPMTPPATPPPATPQPATPPPATPPPIDWLGSETTKVLADVLGISPAFIDLESSFQELGGTSLNAIVASSALRRANIKIAVPDILQSASLIEMFSRHDKSAVTDVEVPSPYSLLPKNVDLNIVDLEDAFPVTPLQEGILTDSMLGRANYVYQRVYKIQGVTLSQVRSALETVIARSNMLRSNFVPWKRTFLQTVNRSIHLPWKTMESSTFESYLQESANEEMSLDEPLIRAAVVKGDLLVLDMHHALFDHWSSQYLFADAISILQGQEPIPRAPFSTYVAYQQKQHNEEAKAFWKDYLTAAEGSILEIPASNEASLPLAVMSSFAVLPSEFCNANGITLGALFHAAWALTLSIQSKKSDVVFMTGFSGRDANIEDILTLDGPTLCIVPMRVCIDESLSAVGFAKAVQDNLWTLSKFAHSGLRNALTDGGLNANTFNTMINILVSQQSVPEDSPLVPVMTHSDNFTQYPTIEIIGNEPTEAKLLVQSSANVQAAQSIIDCFANIVDAMVANPNDLISELPLTSNTHEISATRIEEQRFGLAHKAFEEYAAANPSKLAIRSTNGSMLSYAEMNAKANSFANWLVQHGVRHGEMIPLYMEKSEMTLISIFAILKAGASFTPLDPHNPHDRNSFIINEVRAVRVITDVKNHEAALAFGIDSIMPEQMDLDANTARPPVVSELSGDSTIYAIFTSGSTGMPKGVLVTHSAVTASTEGMIEATKVTSDWNALWVLNYVFDASYYDVFTIFTAGGTLCLAPQDEVLQNLAEYINSLEIEQVMLTPTITKLIRGGHSQVPRLKVLNVCGERIDMNILEWAKSVDVYNGYGPTEATILMTVSKVEPNGSLNSVGFPLKHASSFILPAEGGSLEPVAHGTIGELCVTGPHLAKGYMNKPEQTSAVFVQGKDGKVFYRTGDLARWNDDGSLECFGRKDYQIKLNGLRIELGEIENAIIRTEEVEACVVSVAEVQGKDQLVAFCIFKGDHQPGMGGPLPAGGRLEKVKELMPKLTTISHYMMPAVFLPFGSFPTLPSGKANRKELVALVKRMPKAEVAGYIPMDEVQGDFLPVSTEKEIVMQKAWATVLDEPEQSIGANSAFLALGGDSISAINVVAACRKLSYAITVSNILSNPTLVEQAKHLKRMGRQEPLEEVRYEVPQSVSSALNKSDLDADRDVEVIYPAGPGQAEFLTQGHTKHQFWNLTACRELPQDFDLNHWLETTKALTARNQIMRTMYFQASEDAGSWYQIVLKGSNLNYERVLYSTEAEKIRYMEELRDSMFQFGKANIKYRLVESLVDGSRTLCIKVDHGSYDGTLLRIFDEQFTALARGESHLPAVHSFRQFVNWIHRSDRNAALEYWKKSLGDYNPTHKLPLQPVTDRLKFAEVRADVDTIAFRLGVTASTVFQAAYSLVAGQLSSTNDVIVDNLLTGRNADVENPQLINGTCANFLPFRQRLQGSDSVQQFLKDTQDLFWDTTEHGTVGLHDIYQALGQDRQKYSAKMLYCFQPFEPAPASTKMNHMRWIVMAQSKVYMTINYSLMVEVQKTLTGYRFKLQYDSAALSEEQAGLVVQLFNEILNKMGQVEVKMKDLMSLPSTLAGLWRL
ncbi:hypothetical protein GJ744_001142 [Endocarpon pusillum]|uniref:Carrier domain-containing protein n=1 Tax=Endocarpon pusillum TaxID=364733 RepID=A0A8H7E221_9EURO|nr:hypothetical protein GJ744_001142 [Endocarpon pusillum]